MPPSNYCPFEWKDNLWQNTIFWNTKLLGDLQCTQCFTSYHVLPQKPKFKTVKKRWDEAKKKLTKLVFCKISVTFQIAKRFRHFWHLVGVCVFALAKSFLIRSTKGDWLIQMERIKSHHQIGLIHHSSQLRH